MFVCAVLLAALSNICFIHWLCVVCGLDRSGLSVQWCWLHCCSIISFGYYVPLGKGPQRPMAFAIAYLFVPYILCFMIISCAKPQGTAKAMCTRIAEAKGNDQMSDVFQFVVDICYS